MRPAPERTYRLALESTPLVLDWDMNDGTAAGAAIGLAFERLFGPRLILGVAIRHERAGGVFVPWWQPNIYGVESHDKPRGFLRGEIRPAWRALVRDRSDVTVGATAGVIVTENGIRGAEAVGPAAGTRARTWPGLYLGGTIAYTWFWTDWAFRTGVDVGMNRVKAYPGSGIGHPFVSGLTVSVLRTFGSDIRQQEDRGGGAPLESAERSLSLPSSN